MIRVRKTDAPEELETHGYKHDKVRERIFSDQDEKCYLCERKMSTDNQVEHLVSQSNEKSLKNEWHNLYLACGYCNRHKSASFDHIAHPHNVNVEEEIVQKINITKKIAEFTSSSTTSTKEINDTIELLKKLYNGKKQGLRDFNEKLFWDEITQNYSSFMKHINNYLKDKTILNRNKIINDLSIESEGLGFKYHVIKSNPVLSREFLSACSWNRPLPIDM